MHRQNRRGAKRLTFTVLAVRSVNGGTMPDTTAASERPNRIHVANIIDLFASTPQSYINI